MLCFTRDPDVNVRMRNMVVVYRPSLIRFTTGLTLGEGELAEDLVQETMIRAWQNIERFPADCAEGHRWMFTVARRLMIDHLRRQRIRPHEVRQVLPEHAMVGDITSSAVIASMTLLEAMKSLSPDHRLVIEEVYLRDRSITQVAADLGVPVGTVRSRLHYAVRKLRAAVNA